MVRLHATDWLVTGVCFTKSKLPKRQRVSRRPSSRYIVALTSTFVVAFVSHSHYVMGPSAVFL